MFLLIPLLMACVSLAAVFYIISRKFVYLKKLSPEFIESRITQHNFCSAFFEDIIDYSKGFNIRAHSLDLLAEFEKALRKLRLFVLKLDVVSHDLIKKIRSAAQHQKHMIIEHQSARDQAELASDSADGVIIRHQYAATYEQSLREEEQTLIMSIAKDPRNADLYKKLGIIYMRTTEFEDALQSFETAAKLDPGDISVKRRLSEVKILLSKI